MFDHAKNLSVSYYQRNKVGNLMALFTNDIETVQDCFGSGVLMAADAILLGSMCLYKMFMMDVWLTLLSLIPVGLMFAVGVVVGHYMEAKWDERQKAFSDLYRLCAGKLLWHCRSQGVCQGVQGAVGVQAPQQKQRKSQRGFRQSQRIAKYACHAVCGVGCVHHHWLWRLLGVQGQV